NLRFGHVISPDQPAALDRLPSGFMADTSRKPLGDGPATRLLRLPAESRRFEPARPARHVLGRGDGPLGAASRSMCGRDAGAHLLARQVRRVLLARLLRLHPEQPEVDVGPLLTAGGSAANRKLWTIVGTDTSG